MYRLNIGRWEKNLAWHERFLAQLSLTELPQIINVIRGDMSFVGPRPESPDRVRLYSDWQRRRLAVKPGITGLAQVHGVREQHSSEQKARLDLQYILHASPFLDLSLLLQTFWTLISRFHSRPPAVPPTELRPDEVSGPSHERMAEVVNADRA